MSDEEYLRALGIKIQYLRLLKGMLAIDLADAIKMKPGNLCNCEAGKNFKILTIRRISRGLGMDYLEVMKIEDKWQWMIAEVKRMESELKQKRRDARKSPWKKKRRVIR